MSNFEKLINASDLIEWIIETDPDWCVGSVRSIIDHIDKMPSAQPELAQNLHTTCTDTISRQAAIDALDKRFDSVPMEQTTEILMLRKDLRELPSSQPREGEWIDYSDEGYVECPFCHSATNCDGNKDELHYCFSCGAELRGEQNDND